jgi:hypothetical protein
MQQKPMLHIHGHIASRFRASFFFNAGFSQAYWHHVFFCFSPARALISKRLQQLLPSVLRIPIMYVYEQHLVLIAHH